MNKLVQEIIKPILEADSKITKIVGIYGGRFQPFGPHHKKVYEWLENQFDDAYITTSNIKKPPKHPMNYKEKVRHMTKMGIPSSKIIMEKSPFVAKNLAKKFDKDTTAFVYIFGAKDTGRLGGGKYFQDFKRNRDNLKGHEEHGYYLVAPHMSVSAGGLEVSGTAMRQLLGSDKYDDKERKKLFKKMFGYFNDGIYQMMTNKFKKLFESDIQIVPWDNTKPKPKNPKLFDKKHKDLLHDISLEKAIKKLKIPQKLLKGNRQKLINYIATNPQVVAQILRLATEDINEGLPTKVKSKFKKMKHKDDSELGDDFYDHHKTHSGPHITGKPAEDDTIDWDDENDDNEGGLQKDKDKSKRGYEPVTEDWFKKGSKKDKALKLKISKLYSKAFKMMPGSPAQEKIKKEIEKLRNQLSEGVDLPIEIGDTVKMGKFKNKKVVVKSIDWNEKGDLLINGRPALKFRITKKDIDEFLIYNNIGKIIEESTNGAGQGMTDDGPSAFIGGVGGYAGRNKIEAEKLGWEVIDYILRVDVNKVPPFKKEFIKGKAVSSLPAGIGTGTTPNNPENLTGTKGYNKWKKNIKDVAQSVGMELLKFKQQKDDEKALKKLVAKDSRETLKQQKKDEKQDKKDVKSIQTTKSKKVKGKKGVGDGMSGVKESFTKDWWKDLILEVKYSKPNFEYEWEEAERYPEFVEMGKGGWIELAKKGYTTKYSKIKDNLGNVDLNYDKLETPKKQRFQTAYENGTIELPIVVKFSNNDYDLVGGNTRLAGLVNNDEDPTLWVVDLSNSNELSENIVTKKQLKPREKELLLMGGAYGHMAHPFDDKDLTFGDLKKIITDGLGGQLNREDNVTEKLDGQNIMVSWKDGKLIAARNKGHIKNGGKTALDAKGIASKFKGRGDIANAFNFAMKDLGKSIGALSDKQKEKIFNNGYNFMNLEVMWPKSANVIDYDVAHLVFHGALKYDDSGKVIGEVPGSARMLAGMIKQVNMHIGKKYSISKPVFLTIPKNQDFSQKKDKFISKLDRLRNQYALKDEDTLGLYHQSYWEEYIYNAAQQFGYTISNKILENLTKRWAFFDKSYKIPKIRKDLKKHPEFLDWVLSTDKNDHTKMVKSNMKPFETLFFEVGAEILKNVEGFMAVNPNKAVQGIRKRLKAAISSVKSGGDLKKLNTLKQQLDKLNAIGGTDAIVPSEGIVFKYKGKTYKFTGAFAPINQITGLISF